jgi:hypothetical protein
MKQKENAYIGLLFHLAWLGRKDYGTTATGENREGRKSYIQINEKPHVSETWCAFNESVEVALLVRPE